MPYFAEARQILCSTVDATAQIERLILNVALTQPPRDLGLHQFGAEIEGMGSIPPDAELGKEQGRVLRDVMRITVINVNSVVRRLDAEIGVFNLRSHLGNLLRGAGKRRPIMKLQQRAAVVLRKTAIFAGGKHHPPTGVVLLDRAARVGADLDDENISNEQF